MRQGLCTVGGRGDVREYRAFVYKSQVSTLLPQIMLQKDDIHCQLDIALAQPSDDSRKHVGCEGRTLYPTICGNKEKLVRQETLRTLMQKEYCRS